MASVLELKDLSEEPWKFVLVGRLDTTTSPKLEEYVSKLGTDSWKDMHVDMSECEFVSSAGLRVIVSMQKKVTALEGKLVFEGVLPEVMDVFTMTGFDKILKLA